MRIYDSHEETLLEKVKPYLDGCRLKKDAPQEIVEAVKELHKIAWDLERMQ